MQQPANIRFPGRILFLYEDLALVRRQLDGEDLPWNPDAPLIALAGA